MYSFNNPESQPNPIFAILKGSVKLCLFDDTFVSGVITMSELLEAKSKMLFTIQSLDYFKYNLF